jgi:hypothetical protein
VPEEVAERVEVAAAPGRPRRGGACGEG